MKSETKISAVLVCLMYAGYVLAGGGGGGGGTTTTTTTTTTTVSTTYGTTTTTTTTTTIPGGGSAPSEGNKPYSIVSVAVVRGETKVITLEGVKRKTWADYALWSDNNRSIYFKSGEKFYGKVHSNTELYFSGDPEFFARTTSAADDFQGSTNDCVFHEGFFTGVATQTMASVSFSNLHQSASVVYTGTTAIALSGTNMIVTNERGGLNSYTCAVPANGVVYIETATTGTSGTRPGDANISGTLDGRLTIVTERDINITNHVQYAVDAKTNSSCDDALGLISQHNVVVKPSCPDNLEIYAHILATGLDTETDSDGSFGVENYDQGSPRGQLIVHGGIVQNYRGAVGTFNSGTGEMTHGFEKNYTYDTRFLENPPPEYPPLSNQLKFGLWREE